MALIKQQPFNLDGRKELGKLEMTKEVVLDFRSYIYKLKKYLTAPFFPSQSFNFP